MNSLTINLVITLILFRTVFANNATQQLNSTTTESPIKQMEVKIYYEALCPDSIRFVRFQLYNAMITKKLLKYTDLKFIPYGKVTKWLDPITNEISFICQHGRRECEQNALHACIVEHNTQFEQMQMIDCLLGKFPVNECSANLDINVNAALECKKTRTIEDILEKYGEETEAINLWFVPSIGMDGMFEPKLQNRLMNQFLDVFCSKYKKKFNILPKNCPE